METHAAVGRALDVKWQLTERVDSRKGKKRSSQDNQIRKELEHFGAISTDTTSKIKLTVVSEAYKPSVLSLGCYESAKADAIASVEGVDDRDDPKHRKALYRAGRGAYELHDYEYARDMYQQLLETLPSDSDGLRELKRTNLRIQEAEEGVFDFAAMLKKISETAVYHTEQANFVRRTSISKAGDSFKGLFATEDIAPGDIILCEKAFVASNTPENTPALSAIINPTNNRGLHGSHAAIWIDAVRTSFHNPSLSHDITGLYDGVPRSAASATDSSPLIVDGMPVINVFRMQNIIEHNSFGFAADKDRVRLDVKKAVKADSSGVWSRAARMNHSCLFNSSRGFVGDFIVVRANKNISQGEEITTMYCPVDGNFDQLKHNLNGWGFVCDCKLCKAENKCEESRSSLMFEVESFLKTHPLEAITALMAKDEVPASLVEKAKHFEKLLRKSYPLKLFTTYMPKTREILGLLPTMGKAGIHEWLMFTHWHQPPRALNYATFVLMDHGYRVTMDKANGIILDRTNCVLSMQAVIAMQYIEHYYTKAGNKLVAESARALAEEMYTTFKGSMADYKGFEDC